jgi:DNA-binding protein H-NS
MSENKIDLSGLTPAQLEEVIANAQAAKAEARRARIAALRSELSERIAAEGLKVEDVFPTGRKAVRERGIAPPKYRNPAAPDQTWAGRGKRPVWFNTALQSGVPAEAMLIQQAA